MAPTKRENTATAANNAILARRQKKSDSISSATKRLPTEIETAIQLEIGIENTATRGIINQKNDKT